MRDRIRWELFQAKRRAEASILPIKDVEIEVKVRNNRLKERRERLGLSRAALCEKIKCSPSDYGRMENMKCSPLSSRPDEVWKPIAMKLADFYMVCPEDLFPEEVLEFKDGVRTAATFKVDFEDAKTLLTDYRQKAALPPDEEYAKVELRRSVDECLTSLSKKEADIIRRRFGLSGADEETLVEIAGGYGVSQERIRQQEDKALQKLRHESRSNKLKPFVEG